MGCALFVPEAEGTTWQIATVPVRQIVLLPEPVSFDAGASLGIPFIAAHCCLTVGEHAPRRLGPDALVITTVSTPEKAQLAAAAGADHVINYRHDDVAAEIAKIAPEGVDSIVEVAITKNAAIDTKVPRSGGALASYANEGGSEVTLSIRELMTKNVRVQFVLVYTAPLEAKRHAIDDITLALVTGGIRVGEEVGLPMHHYPLEQSNEAHAAVEAGVVGKVLVDVAD